MSKDSFIRLDTNLIKVLGLNKAVVFCHLLGIQDAINNKRDKQDAIYQQMNRISETTQLNKKTITNIIKQLEELNLLIKIEHTERNKNKYSINKDNYRLLQKLIKEYKTKDAVLSKYNEYIGKSTTKNGTSSDTKNGDTSNTKIGATDKDTNKKDDLKKINSNRQQFYPNCRPITIRYNISEDNYKEYTYNYIPRFFNSTCNDEDIKDVLCNYGGYAEHQALEYFLASYHSFYGTYHLPKSKDNVKKMIDKIHSALNIDIIDEDLEFFKEVVNEYFYNTNTENRTLTLDLLLSNNYGAFEWVERLSMRAI